MSRRNKHNTVIGNPGLTAYSENISSLAETLKLNISDDKLNETCRHTNAEGSSRIPQNVERYQFRRAVCFLGFVHCFWHSEDKKGKNSKAADNKRCLRRQIFRATMARANSCHCCTKSLSNYSCNSFRRQNYSKLKETYRQISSNQKCI